MNKLNRKPRNLDMYKAILTLNTVEEVEAYDITQDYPEMLSFTI